MVVEMQKTKTVALDGTTESGFQYTIPPDAIDDYELLEDLCDIDNGDASKITIAARRLLGDAQLEALKDHVRNENGRVSATKMVEEITQIFNESKVKNS